MLDPILLRTFFTVAQTRSFTEAARRLGVQQSTVSQHVRRLESAVSRALFVRDTHSVALTPDGEAMSGFARSILDTQDEALAYFTGSTPRALIRFGASEDLVLTRLPEILRDFRRSHPLVDVELTVALSGTLHQRLRAGELDLMFGKRLAGQQHGDLVWRDELVWIGGPDTFGSPDAEVSSPVPLIVYPPPSISREMAFDALRRAGREWRVTCTSGSLTGIRAAVLAGLGVTAHTRSLVPAGLRVMSGLPALGDVEFVLLSSPGAPSGPVVALSEAIVSTGDRLGRWAVRSSD